jgi:hypothetical protein
MIRLAAADALSVFAAYSDDAGVWNVDERFR